MRSIDFLIIGQGLAGSALAWELVHRGKKVMVIDEPGGKPFVHNCSRSLQSHHRTRDDKTWMADQLFPELHRFYVTASLSCTSLSFIRYHLPSFISVLEQEQWKLKSADPSMLLFVKAVS